MSVTSDILKLKKEKNAVILAHYYVDEDVQEVADYVGDSFYLSKVATKVEQGPNTLHRFGPSLGYIDIQTERRGGIGLDHRTHDALAVNLRGFEIRLQTVIVQRKPDGRTTVETALDRTAHRTRIEDIGRRIRAVIDPRKRQIDLAALEKVVESDLQWKNESRIALRSSSIKSTNWPAVIYALSDFLIMILSWLVKQSLRAFLLIVSNDLLSAFKRISHN